MKHLKKLSALLLVLLLAVQLLPLAALAADPMEDILGVYEGYYYATQGQTGVTLTVYEEDGAVKATFEFYNLPNRTNAKDGSFYGNISYQNGVYTLTPTAWINHPTDYYMVIIRSATLNGNVLSGRVASAQPNTSTTYEFYAEKANASYSDIQNSLYNDHRYEVVDEGMTWPAAKAYAEERGGHLAVITSAEEEAFVEQLIADGEKNQYWLGGYREGSGFQWVTGEAFGYTNWDKNQPDHNRGVEDYVQLQRIANPHVGGSRSMTWNDAPGDNTIPGEEEHFSLSHVGLVIEYDVWSSASDWAGEELQEAHEKGLIPDVLIGRELDGPITRGEFAAVAVKLYEAISGNRMIIARNAPFTDIENSAERLYILKAYNYSIVNGVSATAFAPDDLITREQMATMLTRVYQKYLHPNYTIETDGQYPLHFSNVQKFYDNDQISDFAYSSVYFMSANNIINGMDDAAGRRVFRPKNTSSAQAAALYANATREQALLVSARTLDQLG